MAEDPKGLERQVAAVLGEAAAVAREVAASEEIRARVAEAAAIVIDCLRAGGKVLLCGNGGSAADCAHIAGELVGRFLLERKGVAAVALTTDTSVLTAIGNDYGYEDVYRRQVEAIGRKGDVLLAYSTSGNAENCVRAVEEAKAMGMRTVALTGTGGGRLAGAADVCIRAPSDVTARAQECHEMAGHTLCLVVERALFGSDA